MTEGHLLILNLILSFILVFVCDKLFKLGIKGAWFGVFMILAFFAIPYLYLFLYVIWGLLTR